MDDMIMNSRISLKSALTVIGVSLLAACTSVPTQLQGEYTEVSPSRVQPATYGTDVRWGGVLVDTRNEEDRTCFEVLSRELDKYMRPKVEDRTAGRFIACTQGFHDPEVYAKGREVTVVGEIKNVERRKIEEFDYQYPMLAVNDLVLWQKRKRVMVYNNHYDPFYYPYYWGRPYGGYYPYYRRPGSYMGSGYMYERELQPGPSQIVTQPDG
jgi:outer membrane lipoprotein